MRPYDLDKFTRAWIMMADGAGVKRVPVAIRTAQDIRRLLAGGWKLEDVVNILKTAETGIADIPDSPPRDGSVEERAREAMSVPQILTDVAIGPAPVSQLRDARYREAQEDLQDGAMIRGLARSLLESAKPMVRTSRKVVTAKCECGREYEQTILKPLPQDLRAMVGLFELADKKVRRSLALPEGIGKVSVKALVDLEPRWKLEQLRNATAMALSQAVEGGTITHEAARAVIDKIKLYAQQAA